MQIYTITTVLLASFFVSTIAFPPTYYQQQPSLYYRAAPQPLMYMQYVQQPSVYRSNGRLTNAASTFVAGESVASGTYLKDNRVAEQQVAASETVLENTGANVAQSVAEAYPAEYPQDDGLGYEVPQAPEDEVPETPQLSEDSQTLEDDIVPEDEPTLEASPEPPIAAAAAPAIPAVQEPSAAAVELDEEAVNDDVDDSDDDYVPNDARRRQVSKASTTAPSPAGSFFSVDFGGASGGAVAISNSYSTGSNGSSKSQAVAFGNPDDGRLKSAPSRRRH